MRFTNFNHKWSVVMNVNDVGMSGKFVPCVRGKVTSIQGQPHNGDFDHGIVLTPDVQIQTITTVTLVEPDPKDNTQEI